MDYIVEYSVNGEIKEEIVSFDDFISNKVKIPYTLNTILLILFIAFK